MEEGLVQLLVVHCLVIRILLTFVFKKIDSSIAHQYLLKTVQVLQSVAFLVSSIAAVIAIVVLQLKSWSRQAPVPQASLRLA